MSDEFYWVAVAVVSVVSAARLTRLMVVDKFPPTRWIRDKYGEMTDGGPIRREWQLLLFCIWCFSFWAYALVFLTGYYSDWHEAWWVTNAVLAGSYASGMVVARDGDDGDGA